MKDKYWHLITELSLDNYVYYESNEKNSNNP